MEVDEREGADITAADMVNPTETSKIKEYFEETTIFVTGGSGFLGRLLIEKLLRTCCDLRRIYILIRPKKGKSCEERFAEYFDDPLYDRLKREQFQSMQKLFIIKGDCAWPDLGMTARDIQILSDEVNCIFHCGAAVGFKEKLRTATYINVRATKDILKIAKSFKDLRSFIHISSAYSFCPIREIDEMFYEPILTGDKLLTLVETLDDETLDDISPIVRKKWPNTYTFTKSIAEDVVRRESSNLPLVIIRPSIVMPTAKEPVAGWINNFYGATGVFVGGALGVIRTLYGESTCLADLVPADYVVNNAIAAACDIGNRRSLNLNQEVVDLTSENFIETNDLNIPIYNYVSAPQKPITWGECFRLFQKHMSEVPSVHMVWHFFFSVNPNRHVHLFYHYLLPMIPAYVLDFLAYCVGRKSELITGYKKIKNFLDAIGYFSSKQWFFRNNNTKMLWNKLNGEDKKHFEFYMGKIDWPLYFHTLTRGCRVYLLKDPLETIPQAQALCFKLKIAHYTLLGLLFLVFLTVIMLFLKLLFKI